MLRNVTVSLLLLLGSATGCEGPTNEDIATETQSLTGPDTGSKNSSEPHEKYACQYCPVNTIKSCEYVCMNQEYHWCRCCSVNPRTGFKDCSRSSSSFREQCYGC